MKTYLYFYPKLRNKTYSYYYDQETKFFYKLYYKFTENYELPMCALRGYKISDKDFLLYQKNS